MLEKYNPLDHSLITCTLLYSSNHRQSLKRTTWITTTKSESKHRQCSGSCLSEWFLHKPRVWQTLNQSFKWTAVNKHNSIFNWIFNCKLYTIDIWKQHLISVMAVLNDLIFSSTMATCIITVNNDKELSSRGCAWSSVQTDANSLKLLFFKLQQEMKAKCSKQCGVIVKLAFCRQTFRCFRLNQHDSAWSWEWYWLPWPYLLPKKTSIAYW